MGYPTPEQAAPVVDALVAVVEQLRRIADRLAAPSPAAGTCDASLPSGVFGTNFIGPCVLRYQHDGPVHQAANGEQWCPREDDEADDPQAQRCSNPNCGGHCPACYEPKADAPACARCRGRKVIPDWGNWDAYHGEPKPKPCPDCTKPDRVIAVAGTLTEAEFEAVRAAGPPPPGEVVTADMVREAVRRAAAQLTCTATIVTFTEKYRCAKPAGHYSDKEEYRDWHRDRLPQADGALPKADDAMSWADWAEGATAHDADRCAATKVTPEHGTVRCMHPVHDAMYHTGPVDGDGFNRWSWHDGEDGATPHTDTPKEASR